MISRLTASAALFAVLSAATITFAASDASMREARATSIAAATLPVIRFDTVEVTGHRLIASMR
ncbi:MAG: hypothetical protein ABIV63_01560 [Caldimonas sp.]